MVWSQVIDPLNNILLSALVAMAPILFTFFALIILKMKVVKTSLIATAIAFVVAVFIYGMPVKLATFSLMHGGLYGLFPICWIVITALFLFNITLRSGQFKVIKNSMATITPDRRLQALLIAFSFGSFLEGTAGFGAPVAITAAMLVGLGFDAFYAAGICLIANTAPVAFGSIGIPITVASEVSGLPEMAISQMVGRTLPFLSVVIPFYLVLLMCGIRKTVEILPAIAVCGVSFAIIQWSCSNFLGPSLPDILAGIGSIISLVLLLKFWKPKTTWKFTGEKFQRQTDKNTYTTLQILRAWSPFILLTIMIIAWGITPVKLVLNSIGQHKFNFWIIHDSVRSAETKKLIPHIYNFNYLSAAGTALFISAVISIPLVGLSYRSGARIFINTLWQLRMPIIAICSVLAFAYLLNDSGIILTLADVLSKTGILFPFFAPVLGWLGVFVTGSDTSSNALFSKLQAVTATSIGVDPVVTVGANVSGGVIGKMVSPPSIVVAAAAGNLHGKEPDLFRFTLKHSLILLSTICLIVIGQAYLFNWIIPKYNSGKLKLDTIKHTIAEGYIYLILLSAIISAFVIFVNKFAKRKDIPLVREDQIEPSSATPDS